MPENKNNPPVTHTTCAYCGVGCGIAATVTDPELHLVDIAGHKNHPANFGRLCSKGSALGETVSMENRLLTPFIGENQVSWDSALDEVAIRLKSTINQYGPDSVALYGSGQLLTEDYYVANKLMKGFIGTGNMDTNSRLCMASTVAGLKRAFGSDTVPGCYEDLELADLIVLVGSNTAWCHPVLFQRIRAAKGLRPTMKVVVIDPRRTDSCDIADLHLPVKAGTDVALFNGLLTSLADSDCLDFSYLDQYTHGIEDALKAAKQSGSLDAVSSICELDKEDLRRFYHLFAETDKVVTAWSQGVNQSVTGTDKVNAMINCHLATGRIGQPGCGPLSLTGQPNAMGGREVGGLANQLAAHMDFSDSADIDRVKRFWNAPNIARTPGKTAVDLFRAIESGDIRFVWILGTNPVVSMPDANRVREALKQCPTVVVSDCIKTTDTSELAHIRLPAAGWSEKDGTVTNSERRISRQRALFPLSGESKPDWWIISRVAQRIGFSDAFNYTCPADIFREHAALSAFENNETGKLRSFNIGAMSNLAPQEYETLKPFQWPLLRGALSENKRLFTKGGFYTPDRKARLVATAFIEQHSQPDNDYPLLLNTGRIRDHWHTMTRTGLSPRLSQHIDEPFIEVHPGDAEHHELKSNELAEVNTAFGSAVIRIRVTESVGRGNLFMPMHWTRQNSRTGHCGTLVNPRTDPWSKQPDCKHTPARIKSYKAGTYGVLLIRHRQDISQFEYATEVKAAHCYRYELAGSRVEEACIQMMDSHRENIDYLDPVTGVKRTAWFALGRLQAIFMIGESLQICDRSWLQESFGKEGIGSTEAWHLLAGVPPGGENSGKMVCACFGIGEESICRTIKEQGFSEPMEVGKAIKAGTNCGSCIPEIRRLINNMDVEVINANSSL